MLNYSFWYYSISYANVKLRLYYLWPRDGRRWTSWALRSQWPWPLACEDFALLCPNFSSGRRSRPLVLSWTVRNCCLPAASGSSEPSHLPLKQFHILWLKDKGFFLYHYCKPCSTVQYEHYCWSSFKSQSTILLKLEVLMDGQAISFYNCWIICLDNMDEFFFCIISYRVLYKKSFNFVI